MSTPPLQRSGSEPGSSPSPATPTREYKFHRPVKNTYGRAKPPTPESSFSSPSFPSLSSNSLSRTSSLLWDRDTSSPFQDRRRSGGKSTGILADRLAYTKLKTRDDSDNDEAMEDASEAAQPDSPSKRKKRELVSAVILPPSPKRSRTGEQSFESAGISSDVSTNTRRQRSGNSLSSPQTSSSQPPPSPSPSKTIVTRRTSANRATLLQNRNKDESEDELDKSLAAVRNRTSGTSVDETKPKQATLSAFFSAKAGKGTGILRSRPKDMTVSFLEPAVAAASSDKAISTKNQKLTQAEPSKKLEQMYLAFSKDPSKSSPSSTSNATRSKIPLSTRTKLLNRESEKSKRFHCPQCGMPYVRGQAEDEQIHERYHRMILGGIDYPGYKSEVVVARYSDEHPEGSTKSSTETNRRISGDFQGSRIVMVSMEPGLASATSGKEGASTFEKKKVKEVLQVVNKELGSVEFDAEQLEGCKVFMYISGKKKVIGCVVAERIKQGFKLLPAGSSSPPEPANVSPNPKASLASTPSPHSILPTPANSASSSSSSIPAKSSLDMSKDQETEGSAIFCSTVPEPAICGINRIWVSNLHRRQKIASRLLEAVRDRFIYACKLEKTDLAFSQPTGDGKALAQRYLGSDQFLVYIE